MFLRVRDLKERSTGLPDHQGELAGRTPHGAVGRQKQNGGSEGPFFVGCGAYKHHIPASVDA